MHIKTRRCRDAAWKESNLVSGDEASNKIENLWFSSFLDSTFWWKGEAVIESNEINSDGETKLLMRSTM